MTRQAPPRPPFWDGVQRILVILLDKCIDGAMFTTGAAAAIIALRLAGVEIWR